MEIRLAGFQGVTRGKVSGACFAVGGGKLKVNVGNNVPEIAVEEELKSESQDIKGLRVKRCPIPSLR